MAFNRVTTGSIDSSAGAGGSTITPGQLKFAAGAASAGLGGAGAFVIGAVAPIPSTVAIVAIGTCLYSAHRMENDLPIIPSFGDNAPTEPLSVERPTVDVTPASA